MANTYTQIYMHVVFAVKNRESLISNDWQDDFYRYIAGALKERGHKPMIINGMPDHVHILFGMSPKESLSDLIQSLKIQTAKNIKEQHNISSFSWQSGYGAFSYNKSTLPTVTNYIEKQKEHHKRISFNDEIRQLLDEMDIGYDEKYILKGIL